jgi:hypothetical protein
MFTKAFLFALAASPLVAAHGKIAVMVSIHMPSLLYISLTYNRPVTPVETLLVSVSREL